MKKILLLFILVFIFFPLSSKGAGIFFGANSKSVSVDSKFEVGVFLNTQNESINAIEGEIKFPADYFELQGFYSGGSIVSFWITQPSLSSGGVVSFSGITPGGLNSAKGYLFSLILKAKKTGDASIISDNEKILLNDGQGSPVDITKAPLALKITKSGNSQNFVPLYDPNPPETFLPQISRDKNIFDNKYFLAFATQDKGAGIDHYEIMETGLLGFFSSIFYKNQWAIAESPYVLEDQTLTSFIYIKAIDKAGNQIIVKVNPKNYLLVYAYYFVWIAMVVFILAFAIKKTWRKKHI
jgi:hypothetical protein